ncbi:hypothetical protein G7Y89_g15189 [Cudoniella acicularis]|uniref:Zn(2)-C6 fungal-type domain-containing protein n=1 Tax=Cudoniella acicularis TaxID=354080 RepID=A0A8H4QRV0_9HELO|nr:hypothetical protein G7Y89_g15189 [Cudoniella acicularis]
MAEEIRLRAACDRCHSQKLRCPRQPGQDVCGRCAKAHRSCVFSPFRQKKLPEGDHGSSGANSEIIQSNQSASHSRSDENSSKRKRVVSVDLNQEITFGGPLTGNSPPPTGDALDHCWNLDPAIFPQDVNTDYSFGDINISDESPLMSFDFDSMIPPTPQWQLAKEPGPNQLREVTTPSQGPFFSSDWRTSEGIAYMIQPHLRGWNSENALPENTSHLIRRLSELGTKLFENAELMPPQAVHDPAMDGQPIGDGKTDYNKYRLEDLLNLTQDLVDLYPIFLNTFFGPQISQGSSPNSDTASPSSFDNDQTSESHDSKRSFPPNTHSTTDKPTPDHASVLLLLSCHLRLINIWVDLFKHMRICIRQRGVALTEAQKKINLPAPRLRVGAYTPPPSVAVSMQMHCFCRFSTQLSKLATELASEIHLEDNDQGSGIGPAALSWAAAQNVKEKANFMASEIGSLQDYINQSGLLD